jgi:hypothetical protein
MLNNSNAWDLLSDFEKLKNNQPTLKTQVKSLIIISFASSYMRSEMIHTCPSPEVAKLQKSNQLKKKMKQWVATPPQQNVNKFLNRLSIKIKQLLLLASLLIS